MDQIAIGKFISECRKEKQLTQLQIAEKLGITDRAVSKWETGKSMPDSSIMLELCGILGITVNELLSGEKMDEEHYDKKDYEKKADENLLLLKRRDENNIKKNVVIFTIYSLVLLIGIMVCSICDIAISGGLTWSSIPMVSIVFAWVISFPVTLAGRKGITGCLVSLSIFLIPYLYILSRLIHVRQVFSIGSVMSLVSVFYLWLVSGIYRKLKTRKLAATGTVLLTAIPFMFVVNITLSRMIEEPVVDIWDIISTFILLAAAFAFYAADYGTNQFHFRADL